jgi:LuxR family maltose regulon positive regulatory protein
MQTALLTTKLYIPPTRPKLVARPRLVERLQAGLRGPLMLISAPAGYGKTTLLSEWRAGAGRDCPVAWFSIDSEDNNLFRFWGYVVAALETLQEGLTNNVASLLQLPQFPTAEELITSLINDLSSFANDFILVLDDYQTITSSKIHQYLTYLVDHLPLQMHLVLLTRIDPSLPLARLRARNQLVELRASDLRFTADETAEFLNTVMGLRLSAENVKALEYRTEGWIAGLQIAALTMQGKDDVDSFIRRFTGNNRYVMDFLVEEVLQQQTESIQNFLLRTSILDRLTGSLCDAVTDQQNSERTLAELELSNLFVVPLDNECQWYRFHHLFSEALQIRLRQSDPKQLLELHRRAARWLEQHDFLLEALQHALAAEDKELTGRLAELSGAQMLARGELMALLDWHERLKDISLERPHLCVDKAWALMLTGQVDEVESLLGRAEQLILGHTPDETIQHMRGHIAAIRCFMASRTGDAPRCIELGGHALEDLPETDPGVRGVVHLALGGTHIQRDDFPAAIQSIKEASRLGKLAGNFNLAVTAISTVANLLMAQGQLHRSEEMYREAMQLARLPNGHVLPIAGRVHSGLCRLFYEWNDLPAANDHARQTYEMGQKWGNADSLLTAHVMLARIHQARGEIGGAEESLQSAENLVRTRQLTPSSAEWVEMARLSLWLVQGNLEACARWMRANDPKSSGEHTLNAGKQLILARILLAQGNHTRASRMLAQFLPDNETVKHWGTVIELLVLQSIACQQKGDLPDALNTLSRALSLAEPEGYIRTFLDEGEPMLSLLRRAASKGLHPAYIRRILAATTSEGRSSQSVQPLIEPLSERELVILRMVAAGKSNQQIGGELFLAVGTVKRHVSNIFGKMNVRSRTECVARARELGLLK